MDYTALLLLLIQLLTQRVEQLQQQLLAQQNLTQASSSVQIMEIPVPMIQSTPTMNVEPAPATLIIPEITPEELERQEYHAQKRLTPKEVESLPEDIRRMNSQAQYIWWMNTYGENNELQG